MQVTKEEKHTVAIVMTLIDEIGKLVNKPNVNKDMAIMTIRKSPVDGVFTLQAFDSVADSSSLVIKKPKHLRAHLSTAFLAIGIFHPKLDKRILKVHKKISKGSRDVYEIDCLVRDIAELMLPPKVFEDFAPIMVKMGESNE